MHLLVQDSIPESILAMRVFNVVLGVVLLGCGGARRHRRASVG